MHVAMLKYSCCLPWFALSLNCSAVASSKLQADLQRCPLKGAVPLLLECILHD